MQLLLHNTRVAMPNKTCNLPQRQPKRFIVRATASKAEELKKMEEYKKNLAQNLENSAKPKASAGPAGTNPGGKELPRVEAADFWDTIKAESVSRPVFIDVFTSWCGPCKLIYPMLVNWQEELGEDKIKMFKFEASKENATVGKALGVKTVPTFIIYKDGEEVERMSGANVENLEAMIRKHAN